MSKKIALILTTLLISSCGIRNGHTPYVPDEPTSERSKQVEQFNKTTANLYALLLSPTNNAMHLMDLADHRIKKSFSTGALPVELAISPNKNHILVMNQLEGTISTYFREDNQWIQFLGTVGSGLQPTDIIFNNKGTEAFIAYNGEGKINVLTITRRDRPLVKYTLVLKNNVESKPYKLAISDDDKTLYVIDKLGGNLYLFNKQENGSYNQSNVYNINPDNNISSFEDIGLFENKLYISDSFNSKIIVFDLNQNQTIANINMKNNDIQGDVLPKNFVINKNDKKLYVVNQGSSSVGVINLNDNSFIKHIFLSAGTNTDSREPSDISISSDGKYIYVTNTSGRNISFISGEKDELLRNFGTTLSSGSQSPLSAIEIL